MGNIKEFVIDPASIRLVNFAAGQLVVADGRGEKEGKKFVWHSSTITLRLAEELTKHDTRRESVVGPGIDAAKTLDSGRIMFNHQRLGLWYQADDSEFSEEERKSL